jgi:signal peptide peptidase SppA
VRLHEILTALTEEPLLITPAAHGSLLKMFQDHANMSAEEFQSKREGVDWCGKEVELAQMEVIDGIAHIPIGGPIGRGLGKFEKGAGAVDVQDLIDELDQAEDDYEVAGVLLDIDSPGGMFNGTPELADRILRCEKPIYAFTSGMMCSAAYWLGCACDLVCATKSATVGSIGVYCAMLDCSKRYADAGVKVDVITSGKYKGAGVPGTSLTDDHRAHLQELIDSMALMFYGHVQTMRPDSSLEDMQGQMFQAGTAAAKGLIDQVVRDKDAVVELMVGREHSR